MRRQGRGEGVGGMGEGKEGGKLVTRREEGGSDGSLVTAAGATCRLSGMFVNGWSLKRRQEQVRRMVSGRRVCELGRRKGREGRT